MLIIFSLFLKPFVMLNLLSFLGIFCGVLMIYLCFYHSIIGKLAILSNGTQLVRLYFDTLFDENLIKTSKQANLKIFDESKAWLDEYFSGNLPNFMPKLALKGSEFQLEVWKMLTLIPYAKTMTYGELAHKIALKRGLAKMSARAIGGALKKNPLPIFIPCHRIIGANSKLTGFTGGIEKKIALLKTEHIDTSSLILPKNNP